MDNTLFFGDNLNILRDRDYFPNDCVDLIYLDPPFNSARDYNLLFKDESGRHADASIKAFGDTWHWGDKTEDLYDFLRTDSGVPLTVRRMIDSLGLFVGRNQLMAYLVMMTPRLLELHRVLKPTGSFYLHCDSTASHPLKMILDSIFGIINFKNEIIWKRTSTHSDSKRYARVSDRILFYTKSNKFIWNPLHTRQNPKHVASKYRFDDQDGRGQYSLGDISSPHARPNMTYDWMGFPPPPKGWRYSKETIQELHDEGRIWYPDDKTKRPRLKRYFDENEGRIQDDVWTDINPINSQAKERLGYPTQKPIALLERIIEISSHPGDIVLDPFCGCGTAIAAAQKLGRKWLGIDITHLSVNLMKYRLKDMFQLEPKRDNRVVGEPEDVAAARALAEQGDRLQFQYWATSLIGARAVGDDTTKKSAKPGADGGIDGEITFIDGAKKDIKRVIVSVKSGGVGVEVVRSLIAVLTREDAAIGVLITLEEPTEPMRREAASAGKYHSPGWERDFPRVQILTIAELLIGATVNMPMQVGTFKQAERVKPSSGQMGLGID